MKKVTLSLLAVQFMFIAGCTRLHSVIVSTGTVLGVQVAENSSTSLYEVKFGYARAEFAFVPGDTNCPGTVPDVLMELRYDNIFKGGMLYQRLAVGRNAVSQPGAALMFGKDSNGNLSSNAVQAISAKIVNIPSAVTNPVTSSVVTIPSVSTGRSTPNLIQKLNIK